MTTTQPGHSSVAGPPTDTRADAAQAPTGGWPTGTGSKATLVLGTIVVLGGILVIGSADGVLNKTILASRYVLAVFYLGLAAALMLTDFTASMAGPPIGTTRSPKR